MSGYVYDRDTEAPLAGVLITVLGHPEWGGTLTRADGTYDFALNGQRYATLRYSLDGYVNSQRQIFVPALDYITAPDVAMVPVDGLTIDLTYGYLDAQFDEYMALNPATNMLEDISNVTTVQQAPENSAALGVQYDFEPFSFGALSARMDVSYKDEFVFHPFQNLYDSADDRTLVNGRLSLNEIKMGCCEKGALRVSLWCRSSPLVARAFGSSRLSNSAA